MALRTFKAVKNADRTHTVTKSDVNNGTSSDVTIIFDDTINAASLSQGLAAATRAVRRAMSKVSAPLSVPNTGSSVE